MKLIIIQVKIGFGGFMCHSLLQRTSKTHPSSHLGEITEEKIRSKQGPIVGKVGDWPHPLPSSKPLEGRPYQKEYFLWRHVNSLTLLLSLSHSTSRRQAPLLWRQRRSHCAQEVDKGWPNWPLAGFWSSPLPLASS